MEKGVDGAHATRSMPAEVTAAGCMEDTLLADWARGLLACGSVALVMLGWLCMQPGDSSPIRPEKRRDP